MLKHTAIALAALLCASAAYGQEVTLRPQLQTSGPAVTLGDVFENAGAVADRAVAVAPAPGGKMTFSARFLTAAAAAAGLEWSAPAGLETVAVTRTGPHTASPAPQIARVQSAAYTPTAPTVIHRGDIVTLVYVAPGLQLTTRAKATSDAALGGPVKLINLQSNKSVDAVATGPAAASASGSQSF
jgi:flagella basal body P-ring formation protein FlgA